MFVLNILSNRERTATLCQTCVYSHVVEGVAGERLTSCTYGYTLRPIKFGVTECSGYFNRTAQKTVTVVAGFIKPDGDRSKAS